MGESKGYFEVAHTADLALFVQGASLDELFQHAAHGLVELMGCQRGEAARPVTHEVALESPDIESLLVDWLNEILYLVTTEAFVPEHFVISHLTDTSLRASIQGVTPGHISKYIKAATYHELSLRRDSSGNYQVTIVFDI